MTTLLVTPAELEGTSVRVQGEAHRHLFRARRLAEGDPVRVVDGEGRARRASITRIERRSAELRLGERAPSREPGVRVEVWSAPPKIGRASWMVEKLTEIGVSGIHLWQTERGPRSYGAGSLDRLHRVARAAVEQCGRSRVPEIGGVHGWSEGLAALERFETLWWLTPAATERPTPPKGEGTEIAILVGPEGGWTDSEAESLRGLTPQTLGLGERVLRIETAAVAAAVRALVG